MPIIKPKSTKKVAKNKTVKKPVKKPTRALVKSKSKPTKNTLAYYQCLCHQTQQGLKGKKISQVAHECKTNALAINKKISTEKLKEVKKLGASFNDFKHDLEEFVKKSIK